MNILVFFLLLLFTIFCYYIIFYLLKPKKVLPKKDVGIITFEDTVNINKNFLNYLEEKGAKIYFFTLESENPLSDIDKYLNNSIFKRH